MKKLIKILPSLPNYIYPACYCCPDTHHCNSCKGAKAYAHYQKETRLKNDKKMIIKEWLK